MYCNLIWQSFPQDTFNKAEIDWSRVYSSCGSLAGKAVGSKRTEMWNYSPGETVDAIAVTFSEEASWSRDWMSQLNNSQQIWLKKVEDGNAVTGQLKQE